MLHDRIMDHVLYVQAEYLLSDRIDRPICLHPSQIRMCERLVADHDRAVCEFCHMEEDND
jgi:hypothetical protein